MSITKVLLLTSIAAVVGYEIAFGFGIWGSYKKESTRSMADQLQVILTQCQNPVFSVYNQCFRSRVGALIEKNGANAVLDSLDHLFERERSSAEGGRVSCHDIGHTVGELGVAQGQSVGAVLARCTKACGYGCQHGALFGEIRKNPKILDAISGICTSVSQAPFTPQDHDACMHGLGHAVSDVASLNIQKSLSYCDQFGSGYEKKKCAEGVFMEIVDSPTFGHPRYQIEGSVTDFCNRFADVYKDVCYETAALHVYTGAPDVQKAKDTCFQIPEHYTSACVDNFLSMMYFVFDGDPIRISSFCAAFPKNQFSDCIQGAVESDVVTNADPQISITLCQKIPQSYQQICFERLGAKVEYVYGKRKRQDVCGTAPSDMKQVCLGV